MQNSNDRVRKKTTKRAMLPGFILHSVRHIQRNPVRSATLLTFVSLAFFLTQATWKNRQALGAQIEDLHQQKKLLEAEFIQLDAEWQKYLPQKIAIQQDEERLSSQVHGFTRNRETHLLLPEVLKDFTSNHLVIFPKQQLPRSATFWLKVPDDQQVLMVRLSIQQDVQENKLPTPTAKPRSLVHFVRLRASSNYQLKVETQINQGQENSSVFASAKLNGATLFSDCIFEGEDTVSSEVVNQPKQVELPIISAPVNSAEFRMHPDERLWLPIDRASWKVRDSKQDTKAHIEFRIRLYDWNMIRAGARALNFTDLTR